jgi:hypothetical protein
VILFTRFEVFTVVKIVVLRIMIRVVSYLGIHNVSEGLYNLRLHGNSKDTPTTLKIGTVCSTETLVPTYQTAVS